MTTHDQHVSSWRRELIIFAVTAGICLGFALYTQHCWEDYYITYRSSKNLALGNGLVFTPGQRVHSFTSPLNTLIPAALSFLMGNHSDGAVLWLFRLLSAAATGFAAVLLDRIARARSLGGLARFLLVGLFALNPLIVDYTINGQETGLMMFVLAYTLYCIMVPVGNVGRRLGLAWAGLMWTRPDGCVYAAFLAAACFLFAPVAGENTSRLKLLKAYLTAGCIAAVLYVPWFVWAWWYFGSPVPHTVLAKGLNHPFHVSEFLQIPVVAVRALLAVDGRLANPFLPHYPSMAQWPMALHPIAHLAGWISAFAWLFPFGRRAARAASLTYLLGWLYLFVLVPYPFPWYLPNLTIFGFFVIASTVQDAADLLATLKGTAICQSSLRRTNAVLTAGVLSLIVAAVFLLSCVAYQLRIQQREIEDGNRKQIGLWLRDNAHTPHDSVFLEPLGYIGYFSQLKMLDWPGLCSPEVVAARKAGATTRPQVIQRLQPDWLVLRPNEKEDVDKEIPGLLSTNYELAKTFDASDRVAAYHWLPGRGYLEMDQTFLVFRRVGASEGTETRRVGPDREASAGPP